MSDLPPQPSSTPYPQPTEPPRRGSGMAIAALVLGLCGLIPFLGVLPALIGIVLGIIVLATGRPGKGLAIGGIIAGLVTPLLLTGLLVSILLPSLGRARELAKRAMSQNNLRTIAQGVMLYENENSDVPPPDLDALVASHLVGPKTLEHPNSPGGRAHDYFYLPPADSASARTIMAAEYADCDPEGRGVVMADGQVQWMAEADFQSALAQPQNRAFAAALRAAEGP